MEKICKHHGLTEFIVNAQNKAICKQCRVENVINHRRKLKQKAVDYKGGCCEICGYNKSIAALEFHHIDPEEKDIDYLKLKNRSWEKLKTEIDKCMLVCSNCHKELHWENC
jgi:hypothetical protein